MTSNMYQVTRLDINNHSAVINDIFEKAFYNASSETKDFFRFELGLFTEFSNGMKNIRGFGIGKEQNDIVGFALYTLPIAAVIKENNNKKVARLNWLAVLPKEQRAIDKKGTTLLNKSCELLGNENVGIIKVVPANKSSSLFYIENGFVQDPDSRFGLQKIL